MKILVISDTHGRLDNAKMTIERLVPNNLDVVLHCGDHIHDIVDLEKAYRSVKFYAVAGNCDFFFGKKEKNGEIRDRLVTLDGVPIYMTHGHRHDVKWGTVERLVDDALAHDAKIAIFGHTHEAYLEKHDGVWVLNPGSLTLPRDSCYPSYALIEVKDGKILDIKILQILKDKTVALHPIMKHLKKS